MHGLYIYMYINTKTYTHTYIGGSDAREADGNGWPA